MIFNKKINSILIISFLLFLCLGTVCASDSTIHSRNTDNNKCIDSMDQTVEMQVYDSVTELDATAPVNNSTSNKSRTLIPGGNYSKQEITNGVFT